MKTSLSILLAASLSIVACGDTDSQATGGGSATSTSSSQGGGSATGTSTSKVSIHVTASQASFTHTDTSAGETPEDQNVGILGLELLKSADDPAPLTVFSLSEAVNTPYNDGSDTVVATVPAATLAAGHYTFARVPVAYVKFTVAGTYHQGALPIPGDFTDFIALSDGTKVDGKAFNQGDFTTTFAVDGTNYGSTSGSNAVFGQPAADANIRLDTSTKTAAYVFPVDLVIDPDVDHDVSIVFATNTFEDFRWTDADTLGYTKGVFDVSASGFETVTQLGANSISITMQ